MARIELSIPEDSLTFTTWMTVLSTDVNIARHLGNEALIAMISEVRFRFWRQAGLIDVDSGRTNLIVTDLAVVYRAEGRLWDVLRFDVGFDDPNRYGGDIVFRVTRQSDETVIALVKSGFVFFDYETGRVAPMPDSVVHALRQPATWPEPPSGSAKHR